MDSKQKYLEESNRVLVLKKALSQLGLMPHAEAKQVVEQFERITNVLNKNTPLGTFIYDSNNKPKYLEIDIYREKIGEYVVNDIIVIDSDTYLDHLLEKNILNTSDELAREVR